MKGVDRICHSSVPPQYLSPNLSFDTEYDRAKVPTYNGSDPPPPLEV